MPFFVCELLCDAVWYVVAVLLLGVCVLFEAVGAFFLWFVV